MRISVVFVAATVLTAPVSASAACMSFDEARHQFGAVHLYWHGSGHCWDASPGRHRYVATRRAREQKVPEVQQPKWREARSELLADNEPARGTQETADAAVAAPDAPPIRMLPVRVAPISTPSVTPNWSERWIEVPSHPVKAKSSPAPIASQQQRGITPVVRGLALFAFGLGLVLTFAPLLMRSGASATGPPSMDDTSPPLRRFAAEADEGSHMPRTDRDDIETKLQSSTMVLSTLVTLGTRGLGTVRTLIVELISRQANAMCWIALRWGRQLEGFLSHGAYPVEVKWQPGSAGAMISRDGATRPFTVPSQLLEETRRAASQSVSPRTRVTSPARRGATGLGDAVQTK